MSHWTTIQTEIRDIPALRSACAELGLTLLENAVARGYGANEQHAPFVIRLKGPYDIAVLPANGGFNLQTDWWHGHVEKEVGKDFGRLLQIYGVHRATQLARARGLAVQRRAGKDGRVQLLVTGL